MYMHVVTSYVNNVMYYKNYFLQFLKVVICVIMC